MAEYLIQDTTLDAIADAINAKTGGSSAMTPAEMVTEIGSIQTGGGGITFNVRTYTQASDELSDNYTYANFANTYFPDKVNKIYLATINNTSTDTLAGLAGVWDAIVTNITVCRRRAGMGPAAGNTFKVGAGSEITIYELDGGAFA